MICVYPADCTDFSSNGLGAVTPMSCTVTETLNGEWELTLVHDIDERGKWTRLSEGCVLRSPVPAAMTPSVDLVTQQYQTSTYDVQIYKITTKSGPLHLRSGTGTNYKILGKYKKGREVIVLNKTTSSWYEVTAPDGKHGYMASQYLTFQRTETQTVQTNVGFRNQVIEARQLRDQPFRIYRVVPELDKVTVYARHVFYDLLDNMIKSLKPSPSAVGASVVQSLSGACLSSHDFSFYSDLTSTAEDVEWENINPVEAIMATTLAYIASLCTRKYTSSANAKNDVACQEFYDSSYNYVGIISFPGLNLENKVITEIWLDIDAEKAGYGVKNTKTVYLRKANYQDDIASGVTGGQYVGDELGTFEGAFYGNYNGYHITGPLFDAMAAYISAGNNSFTIYNPLATASPHGYSYNYMQWASVVIAITFEDVVSLPTVSAASASLGSALTISTNRSNNAATHTLSYRFGNASGLIGSDVGDAVSWTPPLSLASEIPRATSGVCTITCNSFINGKMTGSRTCTVTLTVPLTVVPVISSVTLQDTNETVAAQIGAFVKSLSTLSVAITAEGIYGSSISSYRTMLDGVTYTAASFTASKKLAAAGDMTLTVSVTDSRGRTATYTSTVQVLDYAIPSIRRFSVERCNADGSSAQVDGTKARFSFQGSVSPLNNKNSFSCVVYYKLKNAEAWTQAYAVNAASYTLAVSNQLLSQTYDALSSYDVKIRLADHFQEAEQAVSIGTKGVILDFLADGTGIGIGKVAETPGAIECGWPMKLTDPLSIAYGGTGATSAESALAALGGVKKAGDTMTGNLNISGYLYPSMLLLPTYNDTTNRTVFEGSYAGASSFAAWEDSTGNNRRMLEVRTKAYQNSLDWAVLLRVCDAGTWANYRVFHSGMPSGVPVANGGTGATTAANARSNLGTNNAGNITTGTLAMARLPFKVAYGSGSVAGNSALSINYSGAGFTAIPCVVVSYSTSSGNWSGDNGALKVHSKTTTGATIIVGGNFNTARNIDWIAIGV